jgi:hypothetical protein
VFSPYLFVATYLLLIKFYFKLKNLPEIYFAEGLLIISIASLIFSLLGLPQDSAVLYFVYVPLIISIPMIVSKISLTDFKNLLMDKNKKIKDLKNIFAIFAVFTNSPLVKKQFALHQCLNQVIHPHLCVQFWQMAHIHLKTPPLVLDFHDLIQLFNHHFSLN